MHKQDEIKKRLPTRCNYKHGNRDWNSYVKKNQYLKHQQTRIKEIKPFKIERLTNAVRLLIHPLQTLEISTNKVKQQNYIHSISQKHHDKTRQKLGVKNSLSQNKKDYKSKKLKSNCPL